MTATEHQETATMNATRSAAEITQAERSNAAYWAKARQFRQYRGTGTYPVTVGGYVIGQVRHSAHAAGFWSAYDSTGQVVVGSYRTRQSAIEALARTDDGVHAYRAAAGDGAFGTQAERAEIRRRGAVADEYAALDAADEAPVADDTDPERDDEGQPVKPQVGDRVIEPGTAKGRGTVTARDTFLGSERANVAWDGRALDDWVQVDRLIVMDRGQSWTGPAAYVPCEGGSARCEGLVTDPAHVAAARAEDLAALPYCGPCRVAAHADSVADEPVQGPKRPAPDYRPGFYRLRGAVPGLPRFGAPGEIVAVLGPAIPASERPSLWDVMDGLGRRALVTEAELNCAGAERWPHPES